MKTRSVAFAAAIALSVGSLLATSVLAHQVTYKGTVISTDAKGVKVTVIDEKSKKPVAMVFDIDKDTKILRGDKVVTLAAAQIVKDEKISVTIDHDTDETLALVVRLDPRK